MTKLRIQLLLSFKKGGKIVTRKISCEGVIVRAEQADGEQSYHTAIYFNDIADKDANAIADYVHFMMQKAEA